MSQPQDPAQPGPHSDHQPPDHQPTEQIDTPTAPDTRAYEGQPRADVPGGPTPPGSPATRKWTSSLITGSRRTAVVTGVVGLIVGGVIGGSIGWAVTGNGDHDRRDSAYSRQMDRFQGQTPGANGQQQGPGQRRARSAVVGTITAINGSSWTITARGGRTLTVAIGENTKFGTVAKPQRQSEFAVGDRIAVVGRDTTNTIAATRVAKRSAKAGTPSAPASASTQPS